MKKVAVLAGDGIGPEVMDEAIKVLDVAQQLGLSNITFATKQVAN